MTTARLDLADKRQTLSSSIEQFWLNATSNQQRFVSAQAKLKSQTESYRLVDEQFHNGLKNVVDVLEARDNMLSAEQTKLESKYNTILNSALLRFYMGEDIDL
ncbi:MAG: TolC family protein [Bacteroidaceae bacterium]|nr:TolC family protein [Bacteroidaceae bacterium]